MVSNLLILGSYLIFNFPSFNFTAMVLEKRHNYLIKYPMLHQKSKENIESLSLLPNDKAGFFSNNKMIVKTHFLRNSQSAKHVVEGNYVREPDSS